MIGSLRLKIANISNYSIKYVGPGMCVSIVFVSWIVVSA